MNPISYFGMLARYHVWATRKLFEHVDALPEVDYRHDGGLFFKSVHGTLNHLLVAEHAVWFPRFAEGVSNQVALDAELEADRARLRERLLEAVPRWLPLIASTDATRFDATSTTRRPAASRSRCRSRPRSATSSTMARTTAARSRPRSARWATRAPRST